MELLDALVHYSVALYFGLPAFMLTGYFIFAQVRFSEFSSSSDNWIIMIPGIMLAPIALLFYFLQREKLRFQFIRTWTNIDETKKMIEEIAKEQRWTIRTFKDNIYKIKTNPGFVNQTWGQHITIQLVNGGVLANSIFDTNKGSGLVTFGSNKKNLAYIRQTIESRRGKQSDTLVQRGKHKV